MDISDLLKIALNADASDLHLSAELPPLLRIDGDIQPTAMPPLTQSQIHSLVYDIMDDKQIALYEKNSEIDFAWDFSQIARFRVHIFRQDRGTTAIFRVIPLKILTLQQLGLGGIYHKLSAKPRGLVLITGAAGSGKTSTLAAMVDHINNTSCKHIITLESPIEFAHHSAKSLVSQREIGRDSKSFSTALRAALHEDPDVIMVGEMRDIETIRLALTAAEAGHLVLATMHTSGASTTINRIIDMFPTDEKPLVRSILAESLQAVASQTLLKRKAGGRVVASEIMVATSVIKNLIRDNRVDEIYSALQTGASSGMKTMDQSLTRLVGQGIVSREVSPIAKQVS
jgi:twitching motility protein PilT